MKKRLLAVFLTMSMLVSVIAVDYTTNLRAESNTEITVLEVVSDYKYQELSYLMSGSEPIDLNTVKNNMDDLTKLNKLVPNIEVDGKKVVLYTTDESQLLNNNSEKPISYNQMGYFEQNSNDWDVYSEFYKPSSDTRVFWFNQETDTEEDLCAFSELDLTESNRYKLDSSISSYVESENGTYIKVLDNYYSLLLHTRFRLFF